MSITETARFLQSLRTGHERVDELPPALMPPDPRVGLPGPGRAGRRPLRALGGETAGYKVALTNPAAQRMLGVPYPVFGRLFTARLHESGVTLRAADYVIRLIEVEIAFRMAADVPVIEGGHNRRSIAEHIAALYPAHRAGRAITSPDSTGSRRSRSRPTSPFTAPGSTARR